MGVRAMSELVKEGKVRYIDLERIENKPCQLFATKQGIYFRDN